MALDPKILEASAFSRVDKESLVGALAPYLDNIPVVAIALTTSEGNGKEYNVYGDILLATAVVKTTINVKIDGEGGPIRTTARTISFRSVTLASLPRLESFRSDHLKVDLYEPSKQFAAYSIEPSGAYDHYATAVIEQWRKVHLSG